MNRATVRERNDGNDRRHYASSERTEARRKYSVVFSGVLWCSLVVIAMHWLSLECIRWTVIYRCACCSTCFHDHRSTLPAHSLHLYSSMCACHPPAPPSPLCFSVPLLLPSPAPICALTPQVSASAQRPFRPAASDTTRRRSQCDTMPERGGGGEGNRRRVVGEREGVVIWEPTQTQYRMSVMYVCMGCEVACERHVGSGDSGYGNLAKDEHR